MERFSNLFVSYETIQWVQSRENLILVWLALFTRVWAVLCIGYYPSTRVLPPEYHPDCVAGGMIWGYGNTRVRGSISYLSQVHLRILGIDATAFWIQLPRYSYAKNKMLPFFSIQSRFESDGARETSCILVVGLENWRRLHCYDT